MAIVQVSSSTTIVPLKTALIVGLITTVVALIARYFIARSATGAKSITLPSKVDQGLTVDMKGLTHLNMVLPFPLASSAQAATQPLSTPQWVSCTVDGKLVDIPPEANVDGVGLTVALEHPAGVVVATHHDAGSAIFALGGQTNTVTTINYANAGMPTGMAAQSTSGVGRKRAWNSAHNLIRS